MCQLPARRRTAGPDGFTLLEVLISISILAVGLMASALLMTNTYKFSVRSRFMAEAAQLASEKLEDLNRFPVSDQHVTVMSGDNECGLTGVNCEGSLAIDAAPVQITVGGNTYTVYYSDSVFISASNSSGGSGTVANGSLQETYQTAGSPSPNYVTLTFSPNGQLPAITNSAAPPTVGETFDRRWVIEQDQPVTGVRRITVLVSVMDQTIQPPVTFQMSMVRP
jgi:prepilin-type N-terminal cleavage/methylation domain-containing protein